MYIFVLIGRFDGSIPFILSDRFGVVWGWRNYALADSAVDAISSAENLSKLPFVVCSNDVGCEDTIRSMLNAADVRLVRMHHTAIGNILDGDSQVSSLVDHSVEMHCVYAANTSIAANLHERGTRMSDYFRNANPGGA